MKKRTKLYALAALLLLSACATTEGPPAASAARKEPSGKKRVEQLDFKLASGIYRCEMGKKVEIQRDARNANSIKLTWQGNYRTLQRYD